jgi:dUTP pyrophosphatase
MKVSIINKSTNPLPNYQTAGSAGMDICASLEENVVVQARATVLIPTGLYIALPLGYEAQLRPRSGLALKHGITLPNSPATIDSDYRGELKIILMNLSDTPFEIKNGDRVAQMVIAKYEQISWSEVDMLDETVRGEGGFGHTGV